MTPWLDIIGVTEAGVAALPPELRARVDVADAVLGPPRLLKGIAAARAEAWNGSLEAMLDQIMSRRGRKTVLLASGDPNWFGIGATLVHHLSPDEFTVYPAPSSFQLAAARLNWPLQNVTCLSLHGRAPAALHPHILPGNRILALTTDRQTLAEIAEILTGRGYGKTQLHVLEALGGPEERRLSFPADTAADHSIGDFYVLGIDCVADPDAPLLVPAPGLPDGAFISDGQLTKREVRVATLARLAPFPGALLWDIGAGSGSIGIEWMRAARGAHALCFERNPNRCAFIAHNREALGVPGLEIIAGNAPQSLAGQPLPDAVFLGGDVGSMDLFAAAWQALKPGGRLVGNAVTLDGEAALMARQKAFGGDLVRIGIETLDHVGSERAFRPRLTVTQWAVVKEGE